MVRTRSLIAPVHLMQVARLALLPCAAAFLLLAAAWPMPIAQVTVVLYGSTIVFHLAFPRLRSADLSGVMAIMATLLAFAPGEPVGDTVLRWLFALAAIGLAVLPMKVSRMRARMTVTPYRPLRAFERRRRRSARPAAEQVLHATPASSPEMLALPAPH